jgi:hypothetical protein
LNVIRDNSSHDAVAAARALATFKHDEILRVQIREAMRERDRATQTAILAVM